MKAIARLATAVAAGAVTPAAAAVVMPAAAAVTVRDGPGLHVVKSQALDSRLFAVTVTTPALNGPVNVRILLPTGYARHPRRRYPVLYLLHGTSGGAADWTTLGGAEQATAGRRLIVVMPDIAQNDDGGGWCTNWWNGGARGVPKWETFHIDQLVPWVEENLRTIRARWARAIAGLSQGGFCSISYAARHPDLFGIALSYSGAPDTAYNADAQALVTPIINATEVGLDHVPANSMFGPRSSQEINWATHDPTTLAGNLRDTKLFMYTGNGRPGPLDSGVPSSGAETIEAGVQVLTQLFHRRLDALGIPSYYDDYGPGTHSWPYWGRDLRWSIGPIMSDFAHPTPPPAGFSYMSADGSYGVYGWTVTMHRRVVEFSTLSASPGEFRLAGSGSATVLTPARYTPGVRYQVAIRWRTGARRVVERSLPDGQLRIEVPLGPSDTVQEYPNDGPPVGTTVYTTRVTITRLRG